MSSGESSRRRNIGIVAAITLLAIWFLVAYVLEQLDIHPLLYWVLYYGSFAIHAFLFASALFWAGVVKREVSSEGS